MINVVNVVGRKVVRLCFDAARETPHRVENTVNLINVVNVVLHKVATSPAQASYDITTYDFYDINPNLLWRVL